MFKQRTPLFVIASLITGIAFAQVPPCTHHQGDFCYGSLDQDHAQRSIATTDGNVVIVGDVGMAIGGNVTTTRHGGAWDALVMKVAPDGTILWSKTFGGNWIESLYWVAELPGGDLLAAGYTQSTTGTVAPPVGPIGNDGWYIRMDANGNELWNRRFRSGTPDCYFSDGALTPDGAVLVDGNNGPGIRIDGSGNVLLISDNFSGDAITASVDGTFLIGRRVLGASSGLFAGEPTPLGTGPAANRDIGLVNVNMDGAVNWVHRLIAPSLDFLRDIISMPDGYAIILECHALFDGGAYRTYGGDRLEPGDDTQDRQFWLVRTDLAGEIVWERSLGNNGGDCHVGNLHLDPDGGIVVVGSINSAAGLDVTEGPRGSDDGVVFKLDPTGNVAWDKRWGGSGSDLFRDAVPVPSGYLLIGDSNSPRSGDHQSTGLFLGSMDIWMVQMYPGLPSQWFPDNDGDGYGNACCPVMNCTQPLGHVSNPGDCDDFVANSGDEYLGAPCNDGDWHTIYDMLQPGCICAGTFVDPDDLTPITFTLYPDFDPGETTWELRDMSTQQIAMQGGPYPNAIPGDPIEQTVMIPPTDNQRFQLFVYDGQSNGMQGGRYTLTTNGKRLIDSDGLFQQVSTVSSTLIPISVPLGSIGLTTTSCDRLDLLSTSVIVCEDDPEVSQRYDLKENNTGYQFWIFDPHGSYSRRVFLSHKSPGKGGGTGASKPRYLKLSSLGTLPVPQLKLLNVRVRTQVNGIYGAFGPACTMKIDPNACPITQVNNLPNDVHYSCGQVYTLGGSQRIWAIPKTGVNKYQFQFTDQQAAYVRNIASPTPTVLMAVWSTLPLQPLHVYDVRVRCSQDNGVTYCPWGPSCTIYTAGIGRSAEFAEKTAGVGLHVFPNPSTDGTVRIQLTTSDALEGPAEISVTDISGRTVMLDRVDVVDIVDRPMELHPSLVPGTYVISVSCIGSSFRERFVVQ